jgi:hypothetical protein
MSHPNLHPRLESQYLQEVPNQNESKIHLSIFLNGIFFNLIGVYSIFNMNSLKITVKVLIS